MFKKIQCGITWMIGGFVVFVAAGLINSYAGGAKTLADNLPTALKFAVYGAVAGFVFGYIGLVLGRSQTNSLGRASQSERGAGGFAMIVKLITSIFANLKLLFFITLIIAVIFIYYRYFKIN